MKISYHSLGFAPFIRWSPCYTLEDTINILARLGYDGIEIGALRPHCWPYDIDQARRKKIVSMLNDVNMEVSSICPATVNYNITSVISEEREDALVYYSKCIELAADLKCYKVLFVPGQVTVGQSYEEAWKLSAQALYKLSMKGEKEGVTLMIEQINKNVLNLVDTSVKAVKLANEVNSPNIGFVIDTYHHHIMGEELTDVIRRYSGKIKHVHCEGAAKDSLIRQIPGEGELNLLQFFRALKAISYEGFLSVELFDQDPEKIATKSIKNIKELLKTV